MAEVPLRSGQRHSVLELLVLLQLPSHRFHVQRHLLVPVGCRGDDAIQSVVVVEIAGGGDFGASTKGK